MSSLVSVPTLHGYSIPAVLGEPESGPTEGTVVMAHGIFSDKTENGRYPRQALIHHGQGRRTLAFDWQGHGDHPVASGSSTVAGNIADLDSILRYAREQLGGPLYVVASSFGGSIFLLHQLVGRDHGIERALLLNPVTDYRHTFVDCASGELADGFSAANWRRLWQEGSMCPVPGFVLSINFGVELSIMQPFLGLDKLSMPTMIIHGTSDQSVSYDVTERNGARSSMVTFEGIEGADHAFGAPWEEEASFALIKQWFAH